MAEVVVVMSSDEQKLWRAQQKLIEQQQRMAQGYAKIKKDSRDAGKDAEGAFGTASASLAKYAAGMISVTAAIGLAASAWREVEEAQQKAIESMRATMDPDRSLVQISDTREDLRGYLERADRIAGQYGISRTQARELIFSALSEGFADAVEFIARNAVVVDPRAQATVAGRVPAMFGGAITPQESINATLVAAASSPLNFEQIARALPSAAQGVTLAGGTPTEAIALLSVLASQFKSGDEAATMIGGFGAKVGITPEFAGAGVMGAFARLQAASEEDRKEFLGEAKELNVMYSMLSSQSDNIQERMRQIDVAIAEAGGATSAIARRRQLAMGEFAPRIGLQREEQMLEVSREEALGAYAADRETRRIQSQRRYMESGGGIAASLDRLMDRFGDFAEGIQTALLGREFTEASFRFAAQQARQYETATPSTDLREAASSLRDAAQALRERSVDGAALSAPSVQREANMHSVGAE